MGGAAGVGAGAARSPAPGAAAQRERLLAGMVQAAARHGYEAASVARAIEAAGVSRATFYEHFANKEECFLAAYLRIAVRMRERVRSAALASPASERPRAVLEELFSGAAADPDAARLVLVEALAAGPAVRIEHEALISDTEEAIERFLGESSEGGALQIPAVALLGGVADVLSMRIFERDCASLSSLVEELLRWIDSYRLPAGEPRWGREEWRRLGAGLVHGAPKDERATVPRLPGGKNSLPAHEAASARRERILAATARMIWLKGYASVTVADIVAAARVTRGVFYSQFRCKEDAFLAAQTVGLRESIAVTASEFFVPPAWPDRVWNASVAFFSYLACNPELAYMEIVESNAAGEAAIRRGYDNRMAYVIFLEDGYRQHAGGARLPRLSSEAIAGAILGLMRRQVVAGRTAEMLEVVPQAAYVILAPFLGMPAAMRFVETKSRSVG